MHLGLERARYDWWGVLTLVIALYMVINFVLLEQGGFVTTYVLIPILWTLVALAIWRLGAQRPTAKSKYRTSLIILAISIGIIQVFSTLIGGIFQGFGDSPYAFTPKSVSQNFFYITTALIGMELSRAWLLNHKHIAKLNTSLKLTFTALLYTFISIPLTRITGIGMDLDSLQWINSTFFPSLAQNLLASYLAFLGGVVPALIYRTILQYFAWFCPILPDLDWAIKGLLGTGIPIVALIAVETLYASQQKRLVRKRRVKSKTGSVIGWGVTGLLVLLMVLFSVGAFGFKPIVIVSGSMQPTIDVGDIALVKNVNTDSIKERDIIKFKEGDETSVVHRVIGITTEDNLKVFQTKGDANDGPDRQPVLADQVEGRVIFTIPKIGWLSIGVKELLGQ